MMTTESLLDLVKAKLEYEEDEDERRHLHDIKGMLEEELRDKRRGH